MTSKEKFEEMQEASFNNGFAYIKPTNEDEAHRLGLIPDEIKLPKGTKLYVLHGADGRVLGFTDSRDSAFGAAVQNEFVPVSVH